jgi:hypothetical protein
VIRFGWLNVGRVGVALWAPAAATPATPAAVTATRRAAEHRGLIVDLLGVGSPSGFPTAMRDG